MIVYLNGAYRPKDEARISPDDRGFLFGDGVYEVVRSYGGRLFAAAGHWERLARSLRELRLPAPAGIDYDALGRELIARNQLGGVDGYVYLQITRGEAPRNHPFPAAGAPTVYAYATELARQPVKQRDGVAVLLVPDIRWLRCDIKSLALVANVLAAQQAREAGADEAVLVRDGTVTEGARTNVAAVFDGVVCTHPRNERILGGVTRDLVLGLCRAQAVPVREEAFTAARLAAADEVFLLGTTMEVTPVVRVDGKPVGAGAPGPVTRRLQAAFQALVEQGVA